MLATTLTTGLLLGVLFAGVVAYTRQNAYQLKRDELERAFSSLATVSEPGFDLAEFHEINPEMSVGLYTPSGKITESVGRDVPLYRSGFSHEEDELTLGRETKNTQVAINLPLEETDEEIERLALVLLVLWLPLVLLVAAISWIAATSVFRPLEKLSVQALSMSGANLSERLDTTDSAEFGQFAGHLNEMLSRIEETVARGERFSTDAAHELRTPLAILRMRLETALILTRTPEQYQTSILRSIEEIDRLTGITESLLRSARGEIEPANVINLEVEVMEAIDRWKPRFDDKSAHLLFEGQAATAQIRPEEMRILMDNLLDNALRFAPPDSRVEILLEATAQATILMVNDAGPGIPPELTSAIFDRFVRADDSRNRASGGAGIGLSVCRQIIEARGGKMVCGQSPSGGASIGFSLPRSH